MAASALDRLRTYDPELAALRRAGRAALLMPATFAFAHEVIGNPTTATFAAFGSFAMLLLVDFAGEMRERIEAQVALSIVCVLFICVGTLASRSTVLATVAMTVVAFGVLFAGVVSSVLAGATTTLLLAFVLPVSVAAPVADIPDRVAGWGLACVASLLAIALLWPAPARHPLRGRAIAACRALAVRLRAECALVSGAGSAAEHDAAVERADAALAALQTTFFATPYRPTGLSTSARTVVRLVDELRWLNTIIVQAAPRAPFSPDGPFMATRAVKSAAAAVLEAGAELLDDRRRRSTDELHGALTRLTAELGELERVATLEVPMSDALSGLDPSFRAQELSFVVSQIAANIDAAVAADRRSLMQRLLGRRPAGVPGPLAAARERAGAHVDIQSVWLRNSVRGAVGLGLAVLVASLTDVQHGFWVVFGTLSVLRSTALSTGQSVVRALLGTAAGFFIGGAILAIIGTNSALLWVLLPIVVLFAGLAPATISFAAGQAAFTMVLLILFNILEPVGLRVGVVRIEDVAIGSAVSLVVGLLFWPRGAAAALGRALAQAYVDSAEYFAGTVAYGMSRCDGGQPRHPAPTAAALTAAATSRRLDDTYRGYLAEHGPKSGRLAAVTSLVTGVAGLRLAGDAMLELWRGDDPGGGDRTAARDQLLASTAQMTAWYTEFGDHLVRHGALPEPLAPDCLADSRLIDAVAHDLRGEDGRASATAVRMIWTGDHLDAARRLQQTLVVPARATGYFDAK